MNNKRFKKVYIEISNICNLQCSFCPEVDREKKQLDREKITSYLTQVKPFAERVCFHVMGEPLNHPHFCEFIKIAEALSVPIEITTNGTLLSETAMEALLNKTVVQVNFSLQSFLDNFPNANPDTYLNRIFIFCDKAMLLRPDLFINFRLWNINDRQVSKNKNDYFFNALEKKFNTSLNRNVEVALNKSKKIVGKIYLHFDSRFSWPNPKSQLLSNRGTCHGTRSHVAIHANGTVVPCCLDKEANIALGTLEQSSFEEIINNTRTQKIKHGFEQGVLTEDLCQRCTYILRFKKEKEPSAVP